MTPLDYALRYASFGWPILPLRPREKKPLGGYGLHHASTDEKIIRRWFKDWPTAGVGVALAPAGLCAIDIDPRNGATETPEDFPATLTASTGGGGWHLLYRAPAGIELPGTLGVGIDAKHRGYIAVEPSVHPSERLYGWLDWDVFADPLPAIADAPDCLTTKPAKQTGSERAQTDFDVREAVRAILSTENYHDSMIRLAAHFAALGMRAADIGEVIRGLFEAITERDERWRARYAEIDAAVESAMKKFAPKDDAKPEGIELLRADQVRIEPIRWLWDGHLARGKMHILAGAPGGGKTTIALAVAATITTGGRWPDGTRAEVGNVLIWSGEDDPADTLVPRLRAMDADLPRVSFVGSTTEIVNGQEQRIAFDPAKHLDALMQRIAAEPPSLLIVDPIVSAVAGDSHKNAETRRGLQPLVDLARLYSVAVLGITHFSKGTQGREPTERVTGSLAFGAIARIVFVASKTKDDGRVFLKSKANIASDEGGFGYDIEQVQVPGYPDIYASRVLWGGAVEGNARDVLAEAEAEPAEEEGPTETDEAIDALRDVLSDGEMTAKEVKATMRAAGFTDKVIRLARERLGVQTRREGFGMAMRSLWSLPPDPESAHSCPEDPFVPCPPNSETRARMDTEGTNGADADQF
jgi:hypothetical protein